MAGRHLVHEDVLLPPPIAGRNAVDAETGEQLEDVLAFRVAHHDEAADKLRQGQRARDSACREAPGKCSLLATAVHERSVSRSACIPRNTWGCCVSHYLLGHNQEVDLRAQTRRSIPNREIVGDDQEAVAVGRGIQAGLEGFEAATLDRRGLALGLLDDLVCGVRRELAFLVGLRCLTSDERVFDELPLGLILCDLRRLLLVGRRFLVAGRVRLLGFLGLRHTARLADCIGLGAVEAAVEVAAGQDELPVLAHDLVRLASALDEHGRLHVCVVIEIDPSTAYQILEERDRGFVVAG